MLDWTVQVGSSIVYNVLLTCHRFNLAGRHQVQAWGAAAVDTPYPGGNTSAYPECGIPSYPYAWGRCNDPSAIVVNSSKQFPYPPHFILPLMIE
jgi:hypothetical protein